MKENFYFVICRLDREEDGTKGRYQLCRSREAPFDSEAEATRYAEGINPSREPIVLKAVNAPHGAGSG